MDARDRNSLLFPLIVLLGMLFPVAITMRQPIAPQGPPREQATGAEPTPTPTEKEDSSNRQAQSLPEVVKRFFGLDVVKGAEGQDFSQDSIDFVIATVPDPIGSPLPYLFDSSLESIRQAARSDGFVLDRTYLPWSQRPRAGSGSSNTQARRRSHRKPGILLFRRGNPAPADGKTPSATSAGAEARGLSLLAVMLVGETPTSGIHKEAFAKALEDMEKTSQLLGKGAVCTIRILGPSFTGSAVSLQIALDKWLKQTQSRCGQTGVRAKVISGSATAIAPGTIENGTAKAASFKSMVPYDPDSFRSIWEYLAAHHYCKIALLKEGGTLYGEGRGPERPNCIGQGTDVMKVIEMSFPLYIAQLRREADIERKAMQQTNVTASDARTFLPMPEEEEERAGGGMPRSFSTLSVTYAELRLTNLLRTISREGVRAVGILATDVRDTIFLTREIREHAPDMLIFTFNSDLLYTHPEANTAAYGMLVFTPYPLINANQLWSYPYRGRDWRQQSSSQFAQGVYNAAVALFTEDDGKQAQEKLVEYSPPFDENPRVAGPALWVTVVGNSAMMPVTVLPRADPGEYMFSAKTAKAAGRQPARIYSSAVSFGIVAMSLVLLAFSGILTYLYWPTRTPGSGQNWLAWRLSDPVSPSYQASSRFYLLVCCGVLLLSYAFIAFLFALPFVVLSREVDFRAALLIVLCPFLAGVLLVLLVASVLMAISAIQSCRSGGTWSGGGPSRRVKRTIQVLVMIGSVLGVFAMAWMIVDWGRAAREAPAKAAFDYLRAFDWSARVSPLLPLCLIALAVLLWGFGSFLRLRMVDGIRPGAGKGGVECGFLGLEQDSFKGLSSLESRIKDFFEQWLVLSNIWQVGLLVVAAVLAFYFLWHRFLPTVEGRAYDWLFGSTYFFVYGVLAVESVRLCLLWRDLRRYLKRLAQLPLRAAFARYHKKHPSLARISFATPPPTLTVLEFSAEEASGLVRLAQERDEHVAEWLQEAEPRVRDARNAIAQAHELRAGKDPRNALVQRNEAECALSAVARSLDQVMEHHWRRHPPMAGKKEDPFYILAEEFLAGRAVHFISYVLPAIRNLSAFLLGGLLLMLFAAVSYPFQPQQDFLLFNWIVILGFMGTALTIVLQMERDFVMSSLNGTSPGKVSFSFDLVSRFLAYGVVPLTALLGAQFPDVLRKVLSVFSTQTPP